MFRIAHDGHVARLTLDRYETRNALRSEDWIAFVAALDRIAEQRPRALVITSAHAQTFCAGADLDEIAALVDRPEERTPFRVALRAGIDRLAALPFPTIVAVEGACYGAGVALMLACDVRIAGPDARFAVPPARLGILYPADDLGRLVAQVGRGQAARLLFGAPVIDAAEALRIGLVEQVASRALVTAADYARDVAMMSPGAVRLLKRGLHGEASDDAFDAAFGGPDLAEAIAARGELRMPVFE